MATTAIWNVKGWIGQVVNYVENPDKTENPNFDERELQSLRDVMDYTYQDYKTEKQHYVSGINCSPDIARQQMIMTKKRYGKEGGNVAFHGYQSFAPGEVTPNLAHQLGLRLAQKLWGERFEVIVATHLDKNHIHSHFVLNSVSFKDGKRYNSCKEAYKLMRETSDRICLEHGLSVIENPQYGSKTSWNIWIAEKDGRPTMYNIIREDIDMAIQEAFLQKDFYKIMENKGYEFKYGKYLAVRPKGRERFARLKTLGENYTEERIKQRIIDSRYTTDYSAFQKSKPNVKRYKLKGNLKTAKKITGFRALYLHYMYLLGKIKKRKPNQNYPPILKSELIKFEQYKSQFKLLCDYKIDTKEQLADFINISTNKMDNLSKERSFLNSQIRKQNHPDTLTDYKAQRDKCTREISNLRKTIKTASNISNSSKTIMENLKYRYNSKTRNINILKLHVENESRQR